MADPKEIVATGYDAAASRYAALEQAGFELVSRDSESQLEGDREIEYLWFHAQKRP